MVTDGRWREGQRTVFRGHQAPLSPANSNEIQITMSAEQFTNCPSAPLVDGTDALPWFVAVPLPCWHVRCDAVAPPSPSRPLHCNAIATRCSS